ncbi:hypothetical protein V1477_002167 [Vespula maculifrons]|uniref:Uncharacterized protein n=1 Tax=Vespula maculifrons TaxID=7453 RepID=A0ABD2CVW6_VESMC
MDIGNLENSLAKSNRALDPRMNLGLGYSAKSDNYNGTEHFREFLAHFEFVTKTNCWNEPAKMIILVSCLRRKARSVLETAKKLSELTLSELKS